MPAYYFNLDRTIVQGDYRSYSLIWKDESGTAVDIATWDFYYRAKSAKTTDTIVVAPVNMIKTIGVSGVLDTVEIPINESLSNISPGYYKQEIAVDRGGVINTAAKGTLQIIERITAV